MSKILILLVAVLLLVTVAATGSTAAGAAQAGTASETFVPAGGLGSDPGPVSRRNARSQLIPPARSSTARGSTGRSTAWPA